VSKALSPWFGISLCTLGYLCAINNPASAEARLALGEESLSESIPKDAPADISLKTPSFLAQVTSDGTVNTQVNNDGNTAEITGGETRGDNLFHSFQDFSVETGNEAFFNNADSISNIFSRVTGGNVSDIDGAIRSNGSANLFLINPAGIIFGEGASLNIGGSFYGSSASSILFEDGEFSAADLDNPPLLTVNAPIGLGFRDQPGDIVNRSTANGAGLQLFSGKTISLIGGDINFDGGRVTAPGGIIELGGLTGTGRVNLGEQGDFSFPDNVTKSNVLLSNNAIVDISSSGGGLITVNANNLELAGASQFSTDINAGVGSENAVAGGIEINSILFTADNNSLIHADNLGTGQAGTININTNILDFNRGSAITASNFGQGTAGVVNVGAQKISFDKEWGGIFATLGLPRIQTEASVKNAIGKAGTININTNTLELTNGAQLQVNTVAQGDAGTINISATGAVNFAGQGETSIDDFGGLKVTSGALSQVRGETPASGGRVNITARSLSLIDKGGIIVNSDRGKGNAGEIELNIRDLIFLKDAGQILSQTGVGGNGNAGNIKIDTGSLEITNSSFILADSKGQGNSGDINIKASGTVLLKGFQPGNPFPSQIVNQLTDPAKGQAGDITIDARELIMEDVSFISSSNGRDTEGASGNIDINVDRLQLTENAIINAFTNNNAGAGIITINAQRLDLSSGGKILVATDGGGNAGDINVDISGDIKIDNSIKYSSQSDFKSVDFGSNSLLNDLQDEPSGIYADVTENATGSGGDINISGNSLFLDNGKISASTQFGQGGVVNLEIAGNLTLNNESIISAQALKDATNGGNLNIDSKFIIAYPNGNSDILANAEQGEGGNITINAESLLGIQERPQSDLTNDINASSEFALDGAVNINTSDINPVQGATELPSKIVKPEQTTAQTCSANNREGKVNNGLAIAGRGGISPAPDAPLNSESISDENPVQASIPQPLETRQGKIQPAMGIKVTKSGKIVLTAYRTNNAGERIPNIKPNCN
jgi:filamentous hemagglutinin family protein